jgi:hypothetical protein
MIANVEKSVNVEENIITMKKNLFHKGMRLVQNVNVEKSVNVNIITKTRKKNILEKQFIT